MAPKTSHRIWVRLPNWIGDTVLATPTLRALRQGFPEAHLVAAGRWAEPLLGSDPVVSQVTSYPFDSWTEKFRLAREIRRQRVDLAVILPNSFESALVPWMAGVSQRIGYSTDGRRGFLTHRVTPPRGPFHQVDAYLRILEPLGIHGGDRMPFLTIPQDSRDSAAALWEEIGIGEWEPVVGVHPGATFGPSKLWGPERFAALADRLRVECGARVVFFGAPAERPLWEAVRAHLRGPAISLVGRDHLSMLPALLTRCTALVSGDTGPMHVAAAVGVPVVALFGSTDPRLTAPTGPAHHVIWHRVECAPCFRPHCPIDHRCMRQIHVEEVFEALRERLRGRLTA